MRRPQAPVARRVGLRDRDRPREGRDAAGTAGHGHWGARATENCPSPCCLSPSEGAFPPTSGHSGRKDLVSCWSESCRGCCPALFRVQDGKEEEGPPLPVPHPSPAQHALGAGGATVSPAGGDQVCAAQVVSRPDGWAGSGQSGQCWARCLGLEHSQRAEETDGFPSSSVLQGEAAITPVSLHAEAQCGWAIPGPRHPRVEGAAGLVQGGRTPRGLLGSGMGRSLRKGGDDETGVMAPAGQAVLAPGLPSRSDPALPRLRGETSWACQRLIARSL